MGAGPGAPGMAHGGGVSHHHHYYMGGHVGPGEATTVEFHWNNPTLAAGPYSISVAVSRGSTDAFEVCDYVEDVTTVQAPEGDNAPRGYFGIRCSAVEIYRH